MLGGCGCRTYVWDCGAGKAWVCERGNVSVGFGVGSAGLCS